MRGGLWCEGEVARGNPKLEKGNPAVLLLRPNLFNTLLHRPPQVPVNTYFLFHSSTIYRPKTIHIIKSISIHGQQKVVSCTVSKVRKWTFLGGLGACVKGIPLHHDQNNFLGCRMIWVVLTSIYDHKPKRGCREVALLPSSDHSIALEYGRFYS